MLVDWMQGIRERKESNINPRILATKKVEETWHQVWRDARVTVLGITGLNFI